MSSSMGSTDKNYLEDARLRHESGVEPSGTQRATGYHTSFFNLLITHYSSIVSFLEQKY